MHAYVHPLDQSRAVVNNLLPQFGQAVDAVLDLRTVAVATGQRRGTGSRVASTLRFATTSVLLFSTMFVVLNWGAYKQKALYWYQSINPNAEKTQEQKLLASLLDTEHGNSKRAFASETFENTVLREDAGESIDFSAIEIAPSISYLAVPKLGLTVPIEFPEDDLLIAEDWDGLEKQIQNLLENGVVQYPGTSRPGEKGIVFITGHSSFYTWAPGRYKDVFALLEELKVGDEVAIWHEGVRYVYQAFDIETVNPSDTHVLTDNNTEYSSILRLMTCTPVGTAIDRLVVSFRQVYPNPELNAEPDGDVILGGQLNA